MSDDTGQSGDSSTAGRSALDYLRERYPVPVIGVLMAYMLWVRAQSWKRFVQDGRVFFGGNDPWYHYRNVVYVVHHWPRVMPFDPWTQFPYGVSVNQFGTLYDQLMATAAIVIGLGNPSPHLVSMTVLFTPPVIAMLAAVPVYFIAKRLSGRLGGVIAVAVLAFLPGTILQRGLVGTADHNIAEPLFQASAVALFLVAFYVAERDSPVWEQVRDRDWGALKPVLGWSALAGVATSFYMWVWPPGVLLLGILGVFFLLKLSSVHYNGKSPDHLAFVGATSGVVAAVLMLVPFSDAGFAAASYSLLQPGVALAIAVACIFLAWLSREFEARDVDRGLYPLAVLGVTLVGLAVLAVVLPDVYGLIVGNFSRFIGFDSSAAQRTVGEAQPWLGSVNRVAGGSRFVLIFLQYGLAFFVALLGLAWMLWSPFYERTDNRERWFAAIALVVTAVVIAFPWIIPTVAGAVGVDPTWTGMVLVGGLLFASVVVGDHDADVSFVVVWTIFLIAAAFTQVRFNYYLAMPVAALSGYAAMVVLRNEYVGLGAVADLDATQVVAVLAVVLILLVPLAAPVTLGTPQGKVRTATADQIGARASPGAVLGWYPMLDWMQHNTPQEGNFGGANNAAQLPYYGTFHRTNDFAYPNGSYGVMSWWDYGHWITVLGRRIPDANPFQGGASYAANFLLAQNETHANQVLDSKGAPNERTRYVAVDWKMVDAGNKFPAPTQFYTDGKVSQFDFFHPYYQWDPARKRYEVARYVHTQQYYQTMMARLYRYQGSAMSPQPIVINWDASNGVAVAKARGSNTQIYQQFANMSAAHAYLANHTNAQLGGVGPYPPSYVPALKHYRLVGLSNVPGPASIQQLFPTQQYQHWPDVLFRNMPYWSKLYERVPGATVHGTGPANTNVTAQVTMYSTQLGRGANFTYTQRAQTGPNGKFTMTLPYSTDGYSKFGPQNGHTNVSVRAQGPYQFRALGGSGQNRTFWSGQANVSEGQVNGVNGTAVSVSLQQVQITTKPVNVTTSTTSSGSGGSTSPSNATATGGGASSSGDVAAPSLDVGGPSPGAGAPVTDVGAPALVTQPSLLAAPAERGA